MRSGDFTPGASLRSDKIELLLQLVTRLPVTHWPAVEAAKTPDEYVEEWEGERRFLSNAEMLNAWSEES